MIKRRRTISSDCPDEAMEESVAEQSPTTVSSRKRKRLDPVCSSIELVSSFPEFQLFATTKMTI